MARRGRGKFLGMSKKTVTYVGLGLGAVVVIMFAQSHFAKGGAGGGGRRMAPPPMMHRPPPMMHHAGGPPPSHTAPMMRAHLANQIPAKGPPHGNALSVGGRLQGGYGSGNYMWGSGKLGVPGGGGIQGGYAGYAY